MAFEIAEKNKDIKFPSEWVDYPSGGKFKIRGIFQPEFRRVMEIVNAEQSLEADDISLISIDRINKRNEKLSLSVGSFLVEDWDGIELTTGEKLEYNKENVELIFSKSKQSDNLITFVLNEASRIQKDAIGQLNKEMGKSLKSTSTTTSTQDSTTTKKRKGKPLG